MCTLTYEKCSSSNSHSHPPFNLLILLNALSSALGGESWLYEANHNPPEKQHQKHQKFISFFFSHIWSWSDIILAFVGRLLGMFSLSRYLCFFLCILLLFFKCCKRIESMSLGCQLAPRWQEWEKVNTMNMVSLKISLACWISPAKTHKCVY